LTYVAAAAVAIGNLLRLIMLTKEEIDGYEDKSGQSKETALKILYDINEKEHIRISP